VLVTKHRPVEPNPRPDNEQRGQGTRLSPAHRAPRGLLHPRAVDGQGERARVGSRYRGRYSRTDEAAAAAETPSDYRRRRRNHCPHHHCHPRSHLHFRVRHHRRHCSLPTTLSRRPARAGPPWHRHHRLHRRFPRPAAAAAVTPVAAIVPATILAATAGAAERCDVCEGLLALPPPV